MRRLDATSGRPSRWLRPVIRGRGARRPRDQARRSRSRRPPAIRRWPS
ncbi:MAG: hypothetical protein HY718_14930 [Planctomycetes bacterium]|nr:hypothetical protein [Planctomycetota bacterium]